jgi:DNA polymerase
MYGLDYAEMMGPEKVKKEFKEHRQIGKAAVLGLGYQMGAGRFSEELAKQGIEADAEDIVTKWRKANPKIADWEFGLWRRIERAAKYVVSGRTPGHSGTIDGKLRVTWEDWEVPSLTIELPSGRKLYYPEAELVDSDFGPKLRYKDGGKMTVDTYGGKLVENIVQAISRDLLVNSLFLAEERGLYIIGHVHDEIIVETKDEEAEAAFAALHDCMTTVPTWAAGLPLEAETYTSQRYTK